MTATGSATSSARPVYIDIGKALGTDYFLLKDELTTAEQRYLERTRRVRPRRGVAGDQRLLGARRGARSTCAGGWASSGWSATGWKATAARR